MSNGINSRSGVPGETQKISQNKVPSQPNPSSPHVVM